MKYKKVTIFTPMEILESYEQDTRRLHEEIIEDMLPKEIWDDLDEKKEILNHHDSVVFYQSLIIHATYLAYSLGFSVAYETDEYVIFFISDYVSEEMINYIKEEYSPPVNKYLGFESYATDEYGMKKRIEMETNVLGIPMKKQYETVMGELMKVLYIKNALQETKKSL